MGMNGVCGLTIEEVVDGLASNIPPSHAGLYPCLIVLDYIESRAVVVEVHSHGMLPLPIGGSKVPWCRPLLEWLAKSIDGGLRETYVHGGEATGPGLALRVRGCPGIAVGSAFERCHFIIMFEAAAEFGAARKQL